MYGKALRQGCFGQLHALMLEKPCAYRQLFMDSQKMSAWGHDSVPLCIAISEYREMFQYSGAVRNKEVDVEDMMMLPDIMALVGEISISLDHDE